MTADTLATIWFVLLGALITGYAILDGFDLGVGTLHFLGRTDHERRVILNSIGPLWDGNEVWLVTFGGALFAAFPEAYATVFSLFYVPFMLLLFGLIFRAVSIEFRSKTRSAAWRRVWDVAFTAASALVCVLLGVAGGNLMIGVPIDERGVFQGGLADLLGVFPLAVGALTLTLFMMHGSIYLYLKTEGDLQRRVHGWMWRTFGVFLVVYMLVTMLTLQRVPSATQTIERYPVLWIIPLLNVLALANVPRAIHHGRPFGAFLSSSAVIAALAALFAVAIFPNLVPSSLDGTPGLTIYNASSSRRTLMIMLVIAAIGIPFVATYTAIIYWVFRGKVRLDEASY
jgi:cytochrome d ubiquinol oxidase subunit II